MKRFKVTRIEIWEVEHEMDPKEVDAEIFADAVHDDILNSQDNMHETDDGTYHYTPKEIIEFKVEKLID